MQPVGHVVVGVAHWRVSVLVQSDDEERGRGALLGEDPDILLAMAGKISTELQNIIARRPKLFAQLLRSLKDEPDHAILHLVREVRDGTW